MRQVLFDTETTGLSHQGGDRIVEIGAVEMNHGGLTGRKFHVYVNPERDMPREAYEVHKLSSDFLADKPVFADPSIGQAFCEFVGDAIIVAHNAEFDMGFIQFELQRAGLPKLDNDVIDTVKIARRKFPGSRATLDALCERFEIDLTERENQGHGALLDARLLAEVYIELTGGAQSGFDFDGTGPAGYHKKKPGKPAKQRPGPAPVSITEEERAAHAAFIAEMDNPMWHQIWAAKK